ncbi:hypothetical protein [Clostridium sp. UBA6640]|uniref:hypothetical protein n=1 Tax=Clostridium sp. UBA6640 TaxID=1946370 RepID=UPI0025BC7BEB|nr:hypothetical protein [Clostridium sp. UBA6640]
MFKSNRLKSKKTFYNIVCLILVIVIAIGITAGIIGNTIDDKTIGIWTIIASGITSIALIDTLVMSINSSLDNQKDICVKLVRENKNKYIIESDESFRKELELQINSIKNDKCIIDNVQIISTGNSREGYIFYYKD